MPSYSLLSRCCETLFAAAEAAICVGARASLSTALLELRHQSVGSAH